MAIRAASLGRQSYEFQQDTTVGRWRWTTTMDVSGSTPSFMVTGIVSPFGVLRDSVPIPGDVIEAMGESIVEVRTQFPPAILVGPPTLLTFAVTEGEGFSLPEAVVLTNGGVFGSLLGVTLTASASYVMVSPAQIGNLASNETGSFNVAVNGAALLASNSPYSASIAVQDPAATNTPQVLPIIIEVLPQGTIEVPSSGLLFHVVKPMSGPFPVIPPQIVLIQNTGPAGSVLRWQLQRAGCVPWLASFGPVSGVLGSGESETITVVVAPRTSTVSGVYSETLVFSGFSTNQSVSIPLQLNVT